MKVKTMPMGYTIIDGKKVSMESKEYNNYIGHQERMYLIQQIKEAKANKEAYAKQKQIELLEKVLKRVRQMRVNWGSHKVLILLTKWLEQELKELRK